MEIVKVNDSRYDTYEELLMRRDSLKKEANIYLALYINRFGELAADIFKKKIDCICRKKAISFCAAFANRSQPVDFDQLNEFIRASTEEYREQLSQMIRDNENCRKMEEIPEETVMHVKKIYRRIAKMIHPDINPITADDPVFKELWARVDIAYRCNDLKEMEELELLCTKAVEQAGFGTVVIDIPDIDERIEEVKNEIDVITSTDPYRYKFLLEDEEACLEKEKEMKNELDEYRKYDDELKEILKKYVKNGVTIRWEMN